MQKLLLVLFALAVSAFAQERDFSKVEIKVQKVAGTVYMLTGAGGNIGVSVGDDGPEAGTLMALRATNN